MHRRVGGGVAGRFEEEEEKSEQRERRGGGLGPRRGQGGQVRRREDQHDLGRRAKGAFPLC
eukprot:1013483-Rhodomonas_salina.1